MPRVATHFAPKSGKFSRGSKFDLIPIISVATLAGVPAFLRDTFGERVLQRVNQAIMLDLEAIEGQNCYIPYQTLTTFVAEAARWSGERDLGLLLTPHVAVSSYGSWGAYVLGAATLGEAVDRVTGSLALHTTGDRVSVEIAPGGQARLIHESVAHGLEGYDHIACGSAGVLLSLCRSYLPDTWRPVRIELDIPRPRRTVAFEDMFRCPITFEAPAVAIVLNPGALRMRRSNGTAGLAVTIEDVTRDCMNRSEYNGLLGGIAAQIRSQLMAGGISVESAARSLGTSVRTLQRELNREGTDFRTLTNAVRGSRAIELLRGSDASITEISTQLGYSAPAHFARAFRNVHGINPSEYREMLHSTPAFRALP